MLMTQSVSHHRHRKWLKKVIFICLALILLSLLSSPLLAKQVRVHTDHQQVQMGDIITLIVETDFTAQGEPDFNQMQDQFDLLGTQRSNQIQIINGNYQSFSRWILHISPKQVGELVVPPLEVDGILSQPLIIQVTEAQHLGNGYRGSSFLESTLSLDQAYVQQQVLFTLRFYHQGRFIDGNIRPPVFEDALSEPLQSQFHYQTQINGQRYDVYQWTWAFFPQKSGELTIPPQAFYGRIQYQGRLKQVKEHTQPLQLTVNPKPNTYPAQSSWLPAQSLTLSEDWQINQPIRVGDAITRTIKLDAQGLLHSQLPEWQWSNHADYHLYPEPSQQKNQVMSQGIHSQKSVEVAIVPTEAGSMTLPEITFNWWNTETNQLQTARLPAKTLTILPATSTPPVEKPASKEKVPHETSTSKTTPQTETIGWQIAVATLMGLWFLTVMGFSIWIVKLQNRLKQQAHETSGTNPQNDQAWSNLTPDMMSLCEKPLQPSDAKALFSALLHWQNRHPNKTSEFLETQLTALKAHLYGQTPLAPAILSDICKEVKRLSQTQDENTVEQNRLAPIYPTHQSEMKS
ncbi:hypothetical protein CYQ88_01735 [Hydrogenovibrio sp. SC-1]|nr:hypothetical protein CYQ88_01735 [Hydrogenovibrio sp. SC-1]